MKGRLIRAVCAALIFSAPAASTALAQSQGRTVEADPIRCWWRTSANSVKVGEPFSLVLTCAVLENDTVQVVPDEARLSPSAIQLAPFEIIEGRHPEDLRTGDRRFFQYDARLRIVNADHIGRDVSMPDTVLHYRVNSKLENDAAVQGRDRTYLMPAASVRVLSLVPVNATDIRDSADESFSNIDAIRFRGNLLEIAAIVLVVLGIVMVAFALVRIIALARRKRGEEDTSRGMSPAGVLRLAGRELADVQRERDASGWSEPLVARALAASRVAAAASIGRETSQRVVESAQASPGAAAEGDLTHASRHGRQVRISSPVTSRDLARKLAALPESAPPGRRQLLERLQNALTVLTAAQYSRDAPAEPGPLDLALTEAIEALGELKSAETWPKPQLRRLLGQQADAALTMAFFSALRSIARDNLAEWRSVRVGDLQFWHRCEAVTVLVALLAVVALLLLARLIFRRDPRRHRVMLPAVLNASPRSRLGVVRHAPLMLVLAGIAFLAFAVADPYSALTSRQVSYPGRRIALLIDASTSMRTPFKAATLNRRSVTEATFFTTVAAAERFVRLRIKGKYRDLLSLVEFGNEAYVVTPFTNDYENILLSISLIGDPVEFSMFPDQGTIIARAIEQATELFRAFDFLEASGNLLVIFSDGEDTNAVVHGRSLDDILKSAKETKIPIYFVRTNYDREKGTVIPDDLWVPAVERTGGKFFAASDEDSLLAAINEIDRVSAGTIEVRQYESQRPRFAVFALGAVLCWTSAAFLTAAVPIFRKFP